MGSRTGGVCPGVHPVGERFTDAGVHSDLAGLFLLDHFGVDAVGPGVGEDLEECRGLALLARATFRSVTGGGFELLPQFDHCLKEVFGGRVDADFAAQLHRLEGGLPRDSIDEGTQSNATAPSGMPGRTPPRPRPHRRGLPARWAAKTSGISGAEWRRR